MLEEDEWRRLKKGEEERVVKKKRLAILPIHTHTHTHTSIVLEYITLHLSRYLVSDETDTEELENVRVPHVRQGGRLVAKFLEVYRQIQCVGVRCQVSVLSVWKMFIYTRVKVHISLH